MGHFASSIIFLFAKFCFVGRASLQARHIKWRTFPRILSFHSFYHNHLDSSALDDSPSAFCLLKSSLYAELTVYSPELVSFHRSTSRVFMLPRGICFIALAILASKASSITLSFHHFWFSYRISQTLCTSGPSGFFHGLHGDH